MEQVCLYVLLLAKDWSEATDLGTKRSTDVLRGIRYQILHCCHDVVEQCCSVDQLAET